LLNCIGDQDRGPILLKPALNQRGDGTARSWRRFRPSRPSFVHDLKKRGFHARSDVATNLPIHFDDPGLQGGMRFRGIESAAGRI